MSCNSAGLPSSFDRFRSIWHVDFEFRQDCNHLPVPVAMFAREHRSGAEIGPLTRDQLLDMRRAPFEIGTDVLVTAYTITAELSCFKVLGWPAPANLLCAYFETNAAINGLDIEGLLEKRPNLLEACDLFAIPHMPKDHKRDMRDLILGNESFSAEQWREIADYNRDDVLLTIPLLEAIAPAIDVPTALFRGRYAVAVVGMEARGLPVSAPHLAALREQWQALRMFFIRRDDEFGLYDGSGSFKEDRFNTLAEAKGWGTSWPRTKTGKLELTAGALGKQAKHHSELRPLQHLRDQIAELRLGRFLNTVGVDGYSRCPIMPFWTRSGRNQPRGRDKVFLLSLPSWLHGLIAPPAGWGMALLDWKAQEIGIVAGLSGDPALIADFKAGDPHMSFAIRAGLAPIGATAGTHGDIRNMVKPISLGTNYGMSKYGAAAQSGKTLAWAATMLAAHRHAYPVFTQGQQNTVTQALFDERIESVFGWPMAVHAETKRRTLLNYPAQSNGGECMRLAAIAAYEAGIRIAAPAHDAFWIMAPLSELSDTIAAMVAIMVRAGRAVAGIDIPVEVAAEVRWPQCLGDVRQAKAKGHAMWTEIQALIDSGALQAMEAS
jgi:DNA polymerase family A